MSGVAVVTGGASGFGRAIGGCCAARGFSVALLDIDGERAAAEASALATDHGVRSLGLGVDVGDAADVERAANTVAQQLRELTWCSRMWESSRSEHSSGSATRRGRGCST
jgi:NAD(P)-dependent dehydrogenase (short-subunit alcohol dehydrogenase family)